MDKKRKERNMGKIFKNLIPYWKSVLIIILLLVIQAWCDLALPQYTSDIIDTGIQNSGIEHILPEKIPLDKFRTALNFMTEEEQKDFIDAYNYKSADSDKIVERKELSDEKLKELDDELIIPIIMNYQMSSLPVSTLNKMLKGQNIPEGILNTLEKKTVEKEDEDGNKTKVECVDASPLMAIMIAGSPDSEKTLQNMREQMQKQIDALGTDTLMSSGKAYAKEMDLLAGVDVDEIQTNYLWAAGLRMIVIALILTVAAVLVGFFAARVGAGVGMSLRSKVFKNVIGFSNAEIDRFTHYPFDKRYPADSVRYGNDAENGALRADYRYRRSCQGRGHRRVYVVGYRCGGRSNYGYGAHAYAHRYAQVQAYAEAR